MTAHNPWFWGHSRIRAISACALLSGSCAVIHRAYRRNQRRLDDPSSPVFFAASSVMSWVVPSIMGTMVQPLVLASQSPRRKELLEILGIPFSIVVPTIDETPGPGELPENYVVRIAREKALEVSSRIAGSVVLSADTVVTVDGEILGKPVNAEDAARMLERLSGRQHWVYTAVCVVDQIEKRTQEGLERTLVFFNPMTKAQILDYIRRENVMDKAGAYAIQGFASVYIPRIEGSYSNVMGLPLALVYDLLIRNY